MLGFLYTLNTKVLSDSLPRFPILLLCQGLAGCVHSGTLQLTQQPEALWDEVTQPARHSTFAPKAYLPIRLAAADALIGALPPFLQEDRPLALATAERFLTRPRPYGPGVYGKVGSSTAFLARREAVAGERELYFIMVQVLSEHYGCFMRKRHRQGRRYLFRCRDGRQVVMDPRWGEDWVEFNGYQFDRAGREIVIDAGPPPLPRTGIPRQRLF